MGHEFLYKKFSIGISFSKMSAEQFVAILNKYKEYIHDVYFSPVEDIKYQTRKYIYDFANTTVSERKEDLRKVLEFARDNDIKLNMSLNAINNNMEEQLFLFASYNDIYQLDYITTFLSLAHLIKNQFCFNQITCTYNEGIDNYNKLNQILKSGVFSSLVLGNSLIRNITVFQLVNKYKIKVKLLLNNGCLFDCHNFCKDKGLCKQTFIKQLQQENIHTMYARQSIFPEELHEKFMASKLIDIYKLSTRPIDYLEMTLLLDSYIEGDSRKYIASSVKNYHLYARLSHFCDFYPQFDYDKLIYEKEKMWENIYEATQKTY